MSDFQSDLDEAMSARTHTTGCPGRTVEEECTCGATVILYTAERFEEMRQALIGRNQLAREAADLRGERDDLAAKVKLLEPLATAGREYVAVMEAVESHEPGWDSEDVRHAWGSLKAAAEGWWDR